MKLRVMTRVGAVFLIGGTARLLLAAQGIGKDQLLLIDGATIALVLSVLALGLDQILKPYELIRHRVAEAARSKSPRSVAVEGFPEQRNLAREIDTVMRLLEERMGDPNLGPVYLHGGSRAGERADTFVDGESNDNNDAKEAGDVSRPEVAAHSDSQLPLSADPVLDSVPQNEPLRELFVSYVQALRENSRSDEISSYGEFTEALDEVRQQLLSEHQGYDVLFFLGDGPQIKPRLVRTKAEETLG